MMRSFVHLFAVTPRPPPSPCPCLRCHTARQQVGFHGIIIVGAPFHIIMPAAVKNKKERKNGGTNNWVMNWSGIDDVRERGKESWNACLNYTEISLHHWYNEL